MSRWQANLGWGFLVTLMAGAFWLARSPGEAQEAAPEKTPAPETLLPSEAVAYIGYEGMEGHRAEFEKTAAYKAFYESGLVDAGLKFLKVAQEQSGQGQQISLLGDVYQTLMDNGTSVAISVSANQGPALPFGVVVFHQAAKFHPQLDALIKEAAQSDVKFETRMRKGRSVTSGTLPKSPGVELGWWNEGRHLVLAVGVNAVENSLSVAAGDSPNITKNPLWEKYHETDPPAGMTTLSWLDLGSLRKTFGKMPLPPAGPDAPQSTVGDVITALGLNNTGAVVSRSGFKGEATWSETLLETSGPREGLLAYASEKPLKLEDLPPLPPETLAFHACTVDWTKSYDSTVKMIQDLAKLAPPDAQAQVQGVLNNLPVIIGFDPRPDLFETLGDVNCIYTDGQFALFGSSVVLAQQVKDEKKLTETLMSLVGRAAEQTTPRELMVTKTTKHGREIVSLQIGGGVFNPSFTVADGWLVVGLVPQSVEAFYLRKDGTLDSWEPNDKHKKAFAELPKEFTSLTVTNPESGVKVLMNLAPFFTGMAQAGWQNSPIGRRRGPLPISPADLPPGELVAKPLFPNVRMQTVGEDGIRSYARMSLPTIPVLDSGGGAPAVAIGVALLLPAVQQARQAARRSTSKNNLKQLALAMHNYHEINGHFPPGTHPNEKLKPEERLSWIAEILPQLDQAPLREQIQFDEAWDSKDNDRFTNMRLQVLINPGVSAEPKKGVTAPTHYVGMAGLGKDAPTLPAGHKRAGVFGYNRKTRIRDIVDGTSNTAMISEAHKDFGAWARGGNDTIRPLTKKPYINGPDGIGGPWSKKGAQMVFCDGAVHFISEDIDPTVMERLATMADGQPVGDF